MLCFTGLHLGFNLGCKLLTRDFGWFPGTVDVDPDPTTSIFANSTLKKRLPSISFPLSSFSKIATIALQTLLLGSLKYQGETKAAPLLLDPSRTLPPSVGPSTGTHMVPSLYLLPAVLCHQRQKPRMMVMATLTWIPCKKRPIIPWSDPGSHVMRVNRLARRVCLSCV